MIEACGVKLSFDPNRISEHIGSGIQGKKRNKH